MDAAAAGQPTIDRSALDKVLQLGGAKLLRRLIDMFLENAPERLDRARTAERNGDMDGLERATHSLKSTAGNLGARRLQMLAERIEDRAAALDTTAVRPLLPELENAYAAARTALLQEKEKLAT
ncbi:MAG: Hpt domain-containing protein [Longimicrobiales bacterium]